LIEEEEEEAKPATFVVVDVIQQEMRDVVRQ